MSVNKIIIKGHVGRIETINQGTDKQFVTGSMNVSEFMGKAEDGSPRYNDTWFDIVAFGGKGTRMLSAGIKAGDYIEVEGRMSRRLNEKDGVKYDNWSVIADEFEVLRRKEVVDGGAQKPVPPAAAKPASKAAFKTPPKAKAKASEPAKAAPIEGTLVDGYDNFEDDSIPF
jgi:single-stranded DNA-binding protein